MLAEDWLDGEIDWIDEDNESTAEAKPAGASIAVSLRARSSSDGEAQSRSLDAVSAPGSTSLLAASTTRSSCYRGRGWRKPVGRR